jgi:ApaG protein
MVVLITDGIRVSVETEYQEDYSNPLQSEYMFGYRISIENLSGAPMKLLHRQWEIFDSEGSHHKVEGSGVVGVQPIIKSGEIYQYVSGYTLHSDMGRMRGQYLFKNLLTNQFHHIKVPTFDLVAHFKYN